MSFPRRAGALALCGLALALLGPAPAGGAGLRDQLVSATEKVRRAAPALGVHVVEVRSGETVYAYEPDRVRIVASNAKLFTSAAAVDRLTPGYFLETTLQARGLVLEGRLAGDLAVVGAGDPTISGRHHGDDPLFVFRQWGRELRAAGIERVGGDLVLVDGFFEAEGVHPDWPRDQLHKWYEAPVSALTFNDNCVWVSVRPGAAPGAPASVEITPDVPTVRVESRALTTSRSRSHSIAVDRRPGSNVVEVSGLVYQGAEPFVVAVTVPDPARLFGDGLAAGLAQAGVTLEGAVRVEHHLPESPWRVLVRHRTSLQTVLEVTNKRSQNLYAEALLKLLGAELCGEGSWASGARVVASFLEELGIEPGAYSFVDGSGMSRNDQFSPRQVTALLRHMFFHRHGRAYMQSLAYAGESDLDPPWMTSSLSERFVEERYRHNVVAKTGGLDGVSTLSGYAKGRSGTLYAFSILCNGAPARWRAKQAQDEIVRALVDLG
ncbi:MAG: D-alanyl-D-alanine carboxypeptidase/D-alanyl-D-alanine-endopeptidase [Acidobacteriota bacterium]|nr:D-alanyl-D-alanine carboxypeptidase/D-alanyl-D-alanine-endopeptidase [Acidobacteriota bacterium]